MLGAAALSGAGLAPRQFTASIAIISWALLLAVVSEIVPYYDALIDEAGDPDAEMKARRLRAYVGVLAVRGLTGAAVAALTFNAAVRLGTVAAVGFALSASVITLGILILGAQDDLSA